MGYRENLRAHYAAVTDRLSRGRPAGAKPASPKFLEVPIIRTEYRPGEAAAAVAARRCSPVSFMRVPTLRELDRAAAKEPA